ncbi:MAG: hypothetical protein R3F50_13935 [Gammaproteobacteria bacterium]|jgi:hypothetical protein
MNRWEAFTLHFAVSIAVFTGLLGIIMMLWYPGVLFNIDGGWSGLKLVMGVDVILGPLLTLIVFRAGKPGLKFDLGCIAALQIACMAAGVWIVYQSRPIALVFAYDTFYSLAANEFEAYGKDPGVIAEFSGPWPKLLYTELPDTEFGAEIANLRSQFVDDPLFMQTDKFNSIPLESAALFEREETVRKEAESLLGSTADLGGQGCVLSRFASAHASGFVCYSPDKRKLTRFYPLQS